MLPIELLQQIQAELPFRGSELDTLDAMLHLDSFEDDSLQGMRGSPTRSPAIIIYGPHQAGKTSIVKSFLTSTDEHNHTLIDCKVCVTTKSFYERCVDELLLMKISVDDDGVVTQTSTSIDNLDAFVLKLSQILESIKESNPVLVRTPFSLRATPNASNIFQGSRPLQLSLIRRRCRYHESDRRLVRESERDCHSHICALRLRRLAAIPSPSDLI